MKSLNKGVAEHKLREFVPAVKVKNFLIIMKRYWAGVLDDHNQKASTSTIHRTLTLQSTGLETSDIPLLPPCLFENYYFETKFILFSNNFDLSS